MVECYIGKRDNCLSLCRIHKQEIESEFQRKVSEVQEAKKGADKQADLAEQMEDFFGVSSHGQKSYFGRHKWPFQNKNKKQYNMTWLKLMLASQHREKTMVLSYPSLFQLK